MKQLSRRWIKASNRLLFSITLLLPLISVYSQQSTTHPPLNSEGHPVPIPILPIIPQNKSITLQPGADDTAAINNALAEVSEAGGGTVKLCTGTYLCKTIHLKSNVVLQLEDATIKAIDGTDPAEPNIKNQKYQDFGHTHFQNGLIVGENQSNIKIIGRGMITGDGLIIPDKKLSADKMISLKLCNAVEIGGTDDKNRLTFKSWGHFAILATGCDNLYIHDSQSAIGPCEQDFIDIMECSNVTGYNLTANSGDDVFKIGSDCSLGMKRPCSNIYGGKITGHSGCNVCMIGSETAGDISNVTFEDITVTGAGKSGVGLTVNDGTVLSNVTVKNVTMKRAETPIFIKIANRGRCPNPKIGKIIHVNIKNVTASNCGNNPIIITGFKDSTIYPIEDVVLDHVKLISKGGHPISEGSVSPPELKGEQYNIRNLGTLPAFGLWARYFKNLKIVECNFSTEQPDGRYSMIAEMGEKLELDQVTMQKGESGLLQTKDVTGITVKNSPEIPNQP